jgi:hypothetical protein
VQRVDADSPEVILEGLVAEEVDVRDGSSGLQKSVVDDTGKLGPLVQMRVRKELAHAVSVR